jgi:hypothetical protein
MDWRSSGHFAGICPKRECSERPGLLSSNHIRDLWSRIEPDSSIECLEPGQFEWPANRGVFRADGFQGRELKSSNSQVDWGKAVSLEMAQSELEKGALRVQLRAVIKSAINPPDPSATSAVMPGSVCSFLPTPEVFDKDTGKTQFVLTEGRSIILNTPARKVPSIPTKPQP